MRATILGLPNEILIDIIKYAASAPDRTLFNLRLASKPLESLCHEHFSRYFETIRIDPSRKKNLVRAVEVVSSPTHRGSVRFIGLDSISDWRNVWAVMPLVQRLFDALGTLNVTIELNFKPYGNNDWISEPCIVNYITKFVSMAAQSNMPISRLLVRAKDWDPDFQFDDMICRLERLLLDQETEVTPSPVESLVADFQHGQVTHDRRQGSLRLDRITAYDLHAVGLWVQAKYLSTISLTNCQFHIEQLDRLLFPVRPDLDPTPQALSRLTIINSRLVHDSLFAGSQGAVSIHYVLLYIQECSDSLQELHLEKIRTETPHPRTLNFVDNGRLHILGNENIRGTLQNLLLRYPAPEYVSEAGGEGEDESV